ncbi:hypothetical protein ABBQ38_007757 [Trebouxia sp. C0009 RCD-2024]
MTCLESLFTFRSTSATQDAPAARPQGRLECLGWLLASWTSCGRARRVTTSARPSLGLAPLVTLLGDHRSCCRPDATATASAVNDCSKTHSGPFNSETSGPVPASIQADARGGTGGRPTGLLVADFPYQ